MNVDHFNLFTIGYSFGGLLGLSVTASLWKSTLLTSSILEKNLCCITFSPPLINMPILQEICVESPQINSTLHSIFIKDDLIPRLTMFLDPKYDKVYEESIVDCKTPLNLSIQVSYILINVLEA